MKEPTSRFREEDALVVSVALCNIPHGAYEFWTDGKRRSVPALSPFTVSITDLLSQPVCFVHAPFDYLHFDLPRRGLAEVAEDLGFGHALQFRCCIAERDVFLEQFSRLVVRDTLSGLGCDTLEMGRLGLLLAAHLLQHYAGEASPVPRKRSGLAAWQKKRVVDFLRANLHREVSLTEIATICALSASHFARSFRISFGEPVTHWVARVRLDHAKSMLATNQSSLAEIAIACGFRGQPAFTRWFSHHAGLAPGAWRRFALSPELHAD